jgi:hypothetical protein
VNTLDLYTSDRLNALRDRQDELADLAAEDLVRYPEWVPEINSWESLPETLPEKFPSSLLHYFTFFYQPPPPVDAVGIRQTQLFFEKNSSLVLSLLGFYSLPFTYAFADGAEVLVRSKRILENPGKRLAETALFVMECYRPDAFLVGTGVLAVIAKVRLIHALSRLFIRKYSPDWKPAWGKPINQEDMLATNLTFSLLVCRGMERSGVRVSPDEREGMLRYWGLIGYYLGIDPSFLPKSSKQAFELERLIRKRHLKASPAGKKLMQSLLSYYRQEMLRPELSPFLEAILAHYLGPEIGGVLGIRTTRPIPDRVFYILLSSGVFGLGKSPASFPLLYKQFLIGTKKSLGSEPRIALPSLSR